MTSSPVKELEAAVLALPREDRARLVKHLIESLDEADDIEDAWQVEVRRRLDAYHAGEVEVVDSDEVLEEARRISK